MTVLSNTLIHRLFLSWSRPLSSVKERLAKSDFVTDSNNFDMPRKRREGGAGQKGEKVSVFQAFGQ